MALYNIKTPERIQIKFDIADYLGELAYIPKPNLVTVDSMRDSGVYVKCSLYEFSDYFPSPYQGFVGFGCITGSFFSH